MSHPDLRAVTAYRETFEAMRRARFPQVDCRERAEAEARRVKQGSHHG